MRHSVDDDVCLFLLCFGFALHWPGVFFGLGCMCVCVRLFDKETCCQVKIE